MRSSISLLATASAFALCSVTTAYAQTATVNQSTATDEPDGQATIVVTGSRIARPGAESTSPLTTVTDQDIALRGISNIADLVNDLPSFGTGQTPNTTTFNTTGAGSNFLDLRSLGQNRTLVLENGRRHVGGGTNLAVDINSIPTALVSRVEVITGGASAVYGADAVAGVVNFILKQDFSGADLSARAGVTTRGGGANQNLSAVVGRNFAGGRGNIVAFAEYDKTGSINQDNRALASCANVANPANKTATDGIPALIPYCSTQFTSPYFAAARGQAGDPYGITGLAAPFNQPFIFNDDGVTVRPYNLGTDLGRGVIVGGDGVNFDETRNYQVATERFLAGGRAHFDFTDRLTGAVDVKYVDVKARLDQSPWYQFYEIKEGNAFLPPALSAALLASPTVNSISFYRWDEDWGRQNIRVDTKTYRGVASLDYKISDTWKASTYYQYGKVVSNVVQRTYASDDFFTQATDAIVVGGQIVCRDPAARASGCLPLNPFKVSTLGVNDPAVARLRPYVNNRISIEQQVANLAVTGQLPKLFFAKPIDVVVGAEYRREQLSTQPDALLQGFDTIAGPAVALTGTFDVKEIFGEVVIPVLRDVTLFKELNVEGAVRQSDYSTVGSQTTWKVGGDWQPVGGIRFRSTYARAVRAPNVRELYTTAARSDVMLNDPCDARSLGLGSATRAANCRALGLSSTFRSRANDGFSVQTITSGNPNLDAEVAKTLTAGVVLQPRFLRRFSATVDYYNIRIDGAINTFNSQTLVNSCVDFATIANPFCSTITRGSDGNIQAIALQVINAARLKTSGIDFEVQYSLPVLGGNLNVRGLATKLNTYVFQPSIASNNVLDRAGTVDYPKWRAYGTAVFTSKTLQLSWTTRYYGSVGIGSNAATLPTIETVTPIRYKAQLYNDAQIRFLVPRQPIEFYVGANNLFDKGLPYTYFAGDLGGAGNYDVAGRYVYAGVKLKLR